MKALIKTLFGDRRNLAVVTVIVALEFVLVRLGGGRECVFVAPPLILGGTTWLALRG